MEKIPQKELRASVKRILRRCENVPHKTKISASADLFGLTDQEFAAALDFIREKGFAEVASEFHSSRYKDLDGTVRSDERVTYSIGHTNDRGMDYVNSLTLREYFALHWFAVVVWFVATVVSSVITSVISVYVMKILAN